MSILAGLQRDNVQGGSLQCMPAARECFSASIVDYSSPAFFASDPVSSSHRLTRRRLLRRRLMAIVAEEPIGPWNCPSARPVSRGASSIEFDAGIVGSPTTQVIPNSNNDIV